MDDNVRLLIHLRLDKCQQDLRYARILLDEGGFRQSVNRTYYAVFALASAALLTLDVERRRHSGVESAFNQYLVKPGTIEPEYADVYRRARRWREDADYDDFAEFSHRDAQSILEEAEDFVERVERYLREVGALPGDTNEEESQGGEDDR